MMAPVGPTHSHPPPRFDRGVQLVVLAVTALGSTGLALAIVGWFRPLLAVPAAIAAFAGLWWLSRPEDTREPPAKHPHPYGARAAATVMVGVVVAVTGFHAVNHGEHLLTDRDPGVYITTARWLAAEGDLVIPTADDPFTAADTGIGRDVGFHPVDPDNPTSRRAPQFVHLLPVLMAWGHWVAGTTGLLIVPALLGGVALLALWSFASRFLSPWVATAAVSALAVSPLHLYFTRDAYSEPLTQALLFTGLALLLRATEGRSVRLGLIAGLLLGTTFQARVDALGLLILIPAWLALALLTAHETRAQMSRVILAVGGGAVGAIGLGLVDLRLRSPVYMRNLSWELMGLVGALLAATVASVGAVVILTRRPEFGHRLRSILRGSAPWLMLVVVAVGLFAWLIRPHVTEVRGVPAPVIEAIQIEEGSTVDPGLRYSEDSMRWLEWYAGAPAVALGLLGLTVVAGRWARRPRADGSALLVASALAVSVLYIARPSISPDHLWVMRRYLVVTVPALVFLAAWLVERIVRQLTTAPDPRESKGGRADHRGWLAPTMSAAMVGLLLAVPAGWASWPLRSARQQHGTVSAMEQLCNKAGDDAALAVIPQANLSLTAPLAMRSWCGVPVGVVGVDLGHHGWVWLADAWQEQGRELYVVARTPQAVQMVFLEAEPFLIQVGGDEVERTLSRPARGLAPYELTLAVAPRP